MIEKVTLPNGLRILLEPLEYLHTASFGIWVASGSQNETTENNGASHFIEHMLFKGTDKRSAAQLAEEMDFIGGQISAFTTKEFTCFYGYTLTEHIQEGLELLADMLLHPTLSEHDIENEKEVILDELYMSTDDPEDLVFEQLMTAVWQKNSLGLSILGKEENIRSFTPTHLRRYMKEHYTPQNMILSICGNYSKEKFLRAVTEYFGSLPAAAPSCDDISTVYQSEVILTDKKQEQTYLCLALPGLPAGHPKRFAASILNMIIGGGSSSRLFQRIREQLGLAYSVYSDLFSLAHGGLFCVQASVSPQTARQTTEEILTVLKNAAEGVSEEEFIRAKEGLKCSLLMGMESASARAGNNARRELLYSAILEQDELLAALNAVTLEEVNQYAKELLCLSQLSVSVVGPLSDQKEEDIVFFNGLCQSAKK